MGDSNKGPSTRSLIADAEKLRSDKSSRPAKTKQLVAESEKLIGRETEEAGGSGRAVFMAVAFVVALVGLAVWFWFS